MNTIQRATRRPLDAWSVAALLLAARRAGGRSIGAEAAEVLDRIDALLEREGSERAVALEEWRYAVGMACEA